MLNCKKIKLLTLAIIALLIPTTVFATRPPTLPNQSSPPPTPKGPAPTPPPPPSPPRSTTPSASTTTTPATSTATTSTPITGTATIPTRSASSITTVVVTSSGSTVTSYQGMTADALARLINSGALYGTANDNFHVFQALSNQDKANVYLALLNPANTGGVALSARSINSQLGITGTNPLGINDILPFLPQLGPQLTSAQAENLRQAFSGNNQFLLALTASLSPSQLPAFLSYLSIPSLEALLNTSTSQSQKLSIFLALPADRQYQLYYWLIGYPTNTIIQTLGLNGGTNPASTIQSLRGLIDLMSANLPRSSAPTYIQNLINGILSGLSSTQKLAILMEIRTAWGITPSNINVVASILSSLQASIQATLTSIGGGGGGPPP